MNDRIALRGELLVITTIRGDKIVHEDRPITIDDRLSNFDEVVREIISDFLKFINRLENYMIFRLTDKVILKLNINFFIGF